MELPDAAIAAYPGAGTLRVHPNPAYLAPPDPASPGRNRFDDPRGLIAVRYSATRLRGCLLETMSRFRANAHAKAILEGVQGVEKNDVEWPASETGPVGEWLLAQRVGTIVVDAVGSFLELE